MQNGIVIKSSRAGMTVLLDPNLPFEELLVAIAKKFKDSARFWGAVQMTLTLEGRKLTPEEEMAVVNTITENSQIDVLCLLDTDAQRIERCEKALNEKLMELSAQTGQFYRGIRVQHYSDRRCGAWGQDHGKGKCDRLGRAKGFCDGRCFRKCSGSSYGLFHDAFSASYRKLSDSNK